MKIVDLKTFLSYPPGTVFAEMNSCMVGPIQVLGDCDLASNLSSSTYQDFDLFDTEQSIYEEGAESPIVSDEYYRNGPGLNENKLYAIFGKQDIKQVIERLQQAYTEAKE